MKPINFMCCSTILPTVFDNALSYLEKICIIKDAVNNLTDVVNGLPAYIDQQIDAKVNPEEIYNRIMQELKFYYSDVTDFGADPSGESDSTNAIQSALDSEKGLVVLPPGTYKCNGVRIPSNKIVQGFGAHLVATNSTFLMINKSNGSVGGYDANSNITVTGIDFSAPGVQPITLLSFGHSNNIVIDHCTFHDLAVWHMIEINSCRDVKIRDCKFWNYGTSGGGYSEMIQLDFALNESVFPWFGPYDSVTCYNIEISGCTFTGNSEIRHAIIPAAVGNHTVGAAKISNIDIHDNLCEYLGSAFKFNTANELKIHSNVARNVNAGYVGAGFQQNITIESNDFSGNYQETSDSYECRGIGIYNSDENTTQIVNVRNNKISAFSEHGIAVQGSYIEVSDNYVINCGNAGIFCGYDERASNYKGNVVFGSDRKSIGFADLFCAQELIHNNVIGDIKVYDNTFSTAVYGGYTEGEYSAQKSLIYNNLIKYTLTKRYNTNNYAVYGNIVSNLNSDEFHITLPDSITIKNGWNIIGAPVELPEGTYFITSKITLPSGGIFTYEVSIQNANGFISYSLRQSDRGWTELSAAISMSGITRSYGDQKYMQARIYCAAVPEEGYVLQPTSYNDFIRAIALPIRYIN